MAFYIVRVNAQFDEQETVDEFETLEEAQDMAYEYSIADQSADYIIKEGPNKDKVAKK